MTRYSFVNGDFVPHERAVVHIEDRGYLFADGVYEVVAIVDGQFVDMTAHLDRLDVSLQELSIPWPLERSELETVMRTLIRRNGLLEGTVYLQVTRGTAPREFRFPIGASSSLTVFTNEKKIINSPAASGIAIATVKDLRWPLRHIKSIALLPQVLAKQAAAEKGAFEAWMVDPDGTVTEGGSSNAYIVTSTGVVVTRPTSDGRILKGVTRMRVLQLLSRAGIPVEERVFTPAEAIGAEEAFITGSSMFVLPVVSIDGEQIGDGAPGRMTSHIRDLYVQYARSGTSTPLTTVAHQSA